MKRATLSLVVGLLPSFVLAQEQPAGAGGADEATEILKKCDAACKAVNSARYNAVYRGTGFRASRVPTVEGEVIIGGELKGDVSLFKIDVTAKAPDSEETKKYTVGSDGETYYLIDHATKKVYADIDPMVLGSSGRQFQRMAMIEYLLPEPFSDEINAEHKEIQGTETIGGQECTKIHLRYAGGQGEANWYVAKSDSMPRRVDRLVTNETGEKGATELVITNLAPNPVFVANPYELRIPEGYEKTDDFAP